MSTQQNPPPSHEAISNRAKAIWESEGRPEGQDLAFWLRAEKELIENQGPFASNEATVSSAKGGSASGAQSSAKDRTEPPRRVSALRRS
jgi:hypothetical protein